MMIKVLVCLNGCKPIQVIALSFFTMIMIYASFSLLLEVGQCFYVVKKYINPDVMEF